MPVRSARAPRITRPAPIDAPIPALLSLAAAGAAALLAGELDPDHASKLDRRVRRAMHTRSMRRARRLLVPLFPVGLPGAFIPAAHLIARRLERRGGVGGPAIVAAAWIGWLGQRGVKLFYHRERPRRGARRRFDSYPSGHTTGITAVALTAATILGRQRVISRAASRRIAVGAPLTMGVYRVIADEHWATDVVGGWLCGAAIALGCVALLGDASGGRVAVRRSGRRPAGRAARVARG